MYLKIALLLCFVYMAPLAGALSKGTLVIADQAYTPIENLVVHDTVLSVSEKTHAHRPISHTYNQHATNCIILTLEADIIIATPDQQFYCIETNSFQRADCCIAGQHLLNIHDQTCVIRSVGICECDEVFYGITVSNNHTYFVSRAQILVHNIAPVVIGLGWAFGGGAIEFAGASVGTVLCGIAVGLKVRNDKEKHHQCNLYSAGADDFTYHNDAQAPGKPTEKDGFIPPKRWDGKKIKHEESGKYGYPDKNGSIWIPTGPGPAAHGGPHWDVQHPDGTYDNIMPGGHSRGKGNKK